MLLEVPNMAMQALWCRDRSILPSTRQYPRQVDLPDLGENGFNHRYHDLSSQCTDRVFVRLRMDTVPHGQHGTLSARVLSERSMGGPPWVKILRYAQTPNAVCWSPA